MNQFVQEFARIGPDDFEYFSIPSEFSRSYSKSTAPGQKAAHLIKIEQNQVKSEIPLIPVYLTPLLRQKKLSFPSTLPFI